MKAIFVKAIFSCLNLKPDDGFLPYNMPKVFNKTGNGLTGIVNAWDDFKPVLHILFLGIISTVCKSRTEVPWLEPVLKNLEQIKIKILEQLYCLKN